LVAPMTRTVLSLSVVRPSHSCMNCALIMAVASWSCWSRTRSRLSEGSYSTPVTSACTFYRCG
jgi:hypothetical protein